MRPRGGARDRSRAELRRLALEVAFDDNPDPAFVLDPEGKVAAGNRALLERAGVPADRLREAYRGPTIHPDDRSRVRGEFTAAMAGQARRFECRGVRSDGSAFHVEVSFSPIRGDGEVLGVLGVAHDIDEVAEMRSSLDRSEARLITALDGIGDAIVFVDDDWRMTFLNARATVLLGRGRSELVGTVLWDLDLPDPEGADMLRQSMRTRLPLSRRRFAEDLGRWVEVSSFPAGDLLGIQVRDVTEIEEARRSTQDDARLLHARSMLMDESDDAIVMQGLGGVIEYANASAAAMFGVDGPDLLIGRRLADLLGIDPRVAADLDRTLGRDRIWRGDLDIAPRPGVRLITDNYWTVVDEELLAAQQLALERTRGIQEAEELASAQLLELIRGDLSGRLASCAMALAFLAAGAFTTTERERIVGTIVDQLDTASARLREARLPDEAWDLVGDDTHALVTDLDFGHGISAGPLLRRMADERPWVALVVVTSHLSPELAVSKADRMPSDLVYIVKSRLRRAGDIADAVRDALQGRGSRPTFEPGERALTVTAAQTDMLRMIASGLTTKAIAERRGTTVRAAETMLTRLYAALGVDGDESTSPRVEATRLWLQGRIRVP